jgi:hypothetical protein
MADRTRKKNLLAHCAWSALPLVEGNIGAPIYWRTHAPRSITIGGPMVSLLLLADRTVQYASHIFKPIAYKLSFTTRKRKYVVEKTTATLKIKQTSIAMVRNIFYQ